jgi:hypothetical protein
MAVLFCLLCSDNSCYVVSGWLPGGSANGLLSLWMKCPLCPHTYIFVNKFNLKVRIHDVHSFDQGQAGKELQLPSCTYPPQ